MNLREAIDEYAVHYGLCQEVLGWEGEGVERIRRQFDESVDRLCRVVEVAEAAIAYAEFQADAGRENSMDAASYIRERVKLWNAFMLAKDKAKEVANEST